jgi:formiminotetrahydrofolate cyclodeaminase
MKKFTDFTLENYLNELSGPEPVPGGGSASAYAASLAMGLAQMVGRVSLKRKKKEGLSAEESRREDERRDTIQKIIESLEKTKRDAFQIVNLDPEVYQEVMAAWGTDKLEDALENSFRLQAELAFLAVMGHEWNKNMADLVSGSIKNDLIVSAGLFEAAFKGAYHTALINVCYMKNPERKAHAEKGLQEIKERFAPSGGRGD